MQDLLATLGISDRLSWYKLHYEEKQDVSQTWNCFLHEIQGVGTGQSEMQLHRLSFGPDISYLPMHGLNSDQLQTLQRIKPGPISGVLLAISLYFCILLTILIA